MKRFIIAMTIISGLPFLNAQPLPDFYKKVDRVLWIVDDLDPVIAGWRALGFQSIEVMGEAAMTETYMGRSSDNRVRLAAARLGSATINWIQPLSADNAYAHYRSKHGNGVFSLVHRVPSLKDLDTEIARLKAAGVEVLARGSVGEGGEVSYVFFDTEAQGKYVLGLIYFPESMQIDPPPQAPGTLKLSQYAFVVKDLDATSAFWQKLGFPAMTFTQGGLRDLKHRGQPGLFDQRLGWQRQGDIVYEWIKPVKGPTVYDEHLQKAGEGFHHLAFDVSDIEQTGQEWSAKGFPIVQSGAWGDEGKPGSGKFAYSDTSSIGGITIEFLWNYREASGAR